MASIEEIGYSLVFQADPGIGTLQPASTSGEQLAQLRTRTRALEGMQKEAIVEYGPTGKIWRMVCDEGPWLNGTDLAPFPLAFFASGMAASFMSEIQAEARDRGIQLDELELVQDNFFTMEGSAIRGTMAAGVDPLKLRIWAQGDTSEAELYDIAEVAITERAPAAVALSETLQSRFSIRANGHGVAWGEEIAERVAELAGPVCRVRRLPARPPVAGAG